MVLAAPYRYTELTWIKDIELPFLDLILSILKSQIYFNTHILLCYRLPYTANIYKNFSNNGLIQTLQAHPMKWTYSRFQKLENCLLPFTTIGLKSSQ